jgi:predicted metal-dependent hydrolase
MPYLFVQKSWREDTMRDPTRKFWEKDRIQLEILPDGTVEVTAPPDCDIHPFLEQKRRWIEKKVQERESIGRAYAGGDDLFLFQGRWYRLTHGSECDILEDTITYTTPGDLKEMLEARLLSEVEQQVGQYTPQMGHTVKSISIRTQKSRWGSCSGEGNLNFNLALMALPPPLRTYVILHELVHLVERNHGPKFWERLERVCPTCRDHRNELKKYWILVERNTIWRVLRNG